MKKQKRREDLVPISLWLPRTWRNNFKKMARDGGSNLSALIRSLLREKEADMKKK